MPYGHTDTAVGARSWCSPRLSTFCPSARQRPSPVADLVASDGHDLRRYPNKRGSVSRRSSARSRPRPCRDRALSQGTRRSAYWLGFVFSGLMFGCTVAPMRLGVGGSFLGVRGGISTRGIGVGAGPFSASSSWGRRRRRRSSGGDVGFLAFAIVFVLGFFAAAWPYFLGTFLAVQTGAGNPSAVRSVVGWAFEVAYVVGIVCWWALTREKRAQRAAVEAEQYAQRAAAEAQQHADLIASKAVYQTRVGQSQAYRHGFCTINHRTYDTAARCRQG